MVGVTQMIRMMLILTLILSGDCAQKAAHIVSNECMPVKNSMLLRMSASLELPYRY